MCGAVFLTENSLNRLCVLGQDSGHPDFKFLLLSESSPSWPGAYQGLYPSGITLAFSELFLHIPLSYTTIISSPYKGAFY